MRRLLRLLPALLATLGLGCASRPPTPEPKVAVAAAAARPQAAPREELPWASFSPETFARAKAEHKYIVLDGSAEWCHWCHVMEATTYHDPAVRELLARHFIAVKVDVDARPDIEERYGNWGWPATVLFAPDATELGKYRGYIEPEKFVAILRDVVASGVAEGRAPAIEPPPTKAPRRALSEEHLDWIERSAEVELDSYWDAAQGSWGRMQKAPLGPNNAWALWKAARGDAGQRAKAVFTLDQQSKLLDPVWGGIYQYSAGRDWSEPHFEKLMTFQAPALDNYASAYRLTGEPRHLERARAMLGYLDRFLKGPEGGFYATQDADVNAHDRSKPFVDGHDYYPLDERARLAKGLPRVDTHEYARENGLAIAAYCTMYEATKDPAVLASAEKAARRMLETHATETGGVTHDARGTTPARGGNGSSSGGNGSSSGGNGSSSGGNGSSSSSSSGGNGNGSGAEPLFLADNAALGLGLARLHEVTGDGAYLRSARRIADFLLAQLADEDGGGFFANTQDPDAVGIFARRRTPFEDNVAALRLLARLARALPASESAGYRTAIDRTLRAISTPEQIRSRGRMLGDYLLALEETKGVRGVLGLPFKPKTRGGADE